MKRIFSIAGLGKKLRFHTEICVFREKQILKIDLFHRVKKLFNSNQTGYGVYHGCLEFKTKKNFLVKLASEKSYGSYGNLRISRKTKTNFKNRFFSSGQEVIQIEPNWVWSIPWVPRV